MTLEEQLAAPVDSLIQQLPKSQGMTLEKQLQMSPDEILSQNQTPSSGAILPGSTQITQDFNTYNPSLETFSGGVSRDTNFAASQNTPVKVPAGQWKIISSYNQAPPEGQVGDGENEGYGNDVMAQNIQTGEKLHLIHLATAQVKPGDVLQGGTQVGMTGSSGNATGPNLGIEYYDPQGNLGDVMQSPYAQYLPVSSDGGGNKGGGGFGQILGQIGSSIGNFLNSDSQDQIAMAKGDQQSQQAVMNRLPTTPQVVPQHVYATDTHQSHPLGQVQGLATSVIQPLLQPKQAAQAQTQLEIPQGANRYETQAAPIFQKYGIPIAGALGIWAQEGRGSSKMVDPNNPYDLAAYDSNPQAAKQFGFKTPLEGTEAAAQFMAGLGYADATKKAIFQKALAQYKKDGNVENWVQTIAPTYASDKNWANGAINSPEFKRWIATKN